MLRVTSSLVHKSCQGFPIFIGPLVACTATRINKATLTTFRPLRVHLPEPPKALKLRYAFLTLYSFKPFQSGNDMRHHVEVHASHREKEWESPSGSLIEKDPVVPDVDIAAHVGRDFFLDEKIPRHESGQGYVRVVEHSVMWKRWLPLRSSLTKGQQHARRSTRAGQS